jgi:hypothetical protein
MARLILFSIRSYSMVSKPEFVLSTRGLANILESESRKDFEFVVGNSRCLCPSLIADFLFPLLCRLHSVDETINSFRISTKDYDSQFDDFVRLGRGFPLLVTDANRPFLISVCAQLENRELHKRLIVSSGGKVSCSNVIEQIKSLERFGDGLSSKVSFAASHFFEISSSYLSSLSFSAFAEVAGHANLKLARDDSLFELICERIPSDSRFFGVLQFVRVEFLSVANFTKFTKFFDFVCDSFDCFTISHWASLRSRLTLPVSPPLPNGRCSNHRGLFCIAHLPLRESIRI